MYSWGHNVLKVSLAYTEHITYIRQTCKGQLVFLFQQKHHQSFNTQSCTNPQDYTFSHDIIFHQSCWRAERRVWRIQIYAPTVYSSTCTVHACLFVCLHACVVTSCVCSSDVLCGVGSAWWWRYTVGNMIYIPLLYCPGRKKKKILLPLQHHQYFAYHSPPSPKYECWDCCPWCFRKELEIIKTTRSNFINTVPRVLVCNCKYILTRVHECVYIRNNNSAVGSNAAQVPYHCNLSSSKF